ncbi:hypothetical protein GO988_15555 [Hymenobacter sp. HMF4947]|uniref:Uncharacterized protein n=1 Tax=Hymenobacter ginkgonis TaxID=2682976 RepID=A0A7K1TH74_9BACT|nr:hypothetical protein [Hymenobacter ginkgonis]MVN77749.1 hypothetical protein [Hymenobacter ginkgonis]
METLQIGAITRQVPATWNELTRKQLLRVLAELYAAPRPGRQLRLLHLLTGFPLPLLATQPVVVLAQLLPLTHWLNSEAHLLTEQLLPSLVIPGRRLSEPATTWHGPRGYLQNLLFGEFMFADTFFVLYCLHGTQDLLDQFLTVLYRPARRGASPEDDDWNGDVRLAFNEHQLETRTPRAFRIDALQKLAVVTWYRGCRALLAQEFPDVFVAADEDDKTRAKQAPDWSRVLRQFAGGAFGPVENTARQPLRLVLADMQDAAAEVNRLKNKK